MDETQDVINSALGIKPPQPLTFGQAVDAVYGPSDQTKHLQQRREELQGTPGTSVGQELQKNYLPGVSSVTRYMDERVYGDAVKRFNEGSASKEDARLIAERMHQAEVEKNESIGRSALREATKIPAMLGEFAAGGTVVRGAGVATGLVGRAPAVAPSLLRTAASRGAQGALATPLIPSSYAEKFAQNQNEKPDESTFQQLAPAVALAASQNAVLGQVQGALSKAPISRLGRIVGKTGLGLGESAAADVATTQLDRATKEVTDYSLGLDTKHGTLGALVRGDEGSAKQAIVQALTFSIFSTMHSGKEAGKDVIAKTKAAFDSGPVDDVAPAIVANANRIKSALERNPDLTREQAATLFQDHPPGPILDAALAMVDALPAAKTAPVQPPKPGLPLEVLKPAPEVPTSEFPKLPTNPLDRLPPEQVKELAASLGFKSIKEFRSKSGEPWVAKVVEAALGQEAPPTAPEKAEITASSPSAEAEIAPPAQSQEPGRLDKVVRVAGLEDNLGKTTENEVHLHFGDRVVTLAHDPKSNTVEVGFDTRVSSQKATVPKELQAGTKELFDNMKKLLTSMRDQGLNVKYNTEPRRDRAYGSMLQSLGYRLIGRKAEGDKVSASWRAPLTGEETPKSMIGDQIRTPESPSLMDRFRQAGRAPAAPKVPAVVPRTPKPAVDPRGLLRTAGGQAAALRNRAAQFQNEVPPPQVAPKPVAPTGGSKAMLERVWQSRVPQARQHVGRAINDPSPENLQAARGAVESVRRIATARGMDAQQAIDHELPRWAAFEAKESEIPKLDSPEAIKWAEGAIKKHEREVKREAAHQLAASKRAGESPAEAHTEIARIESAVREAAPAPKAQAGGRPSAAESGPSGELGHVGAATAIATAGGKPIPAHYELRELGAVKASHEAKPPHNLRDRAAAGEYPAGLQPRNYAEPGELNKVWDNAKAMETGYYISEHPDATNGPPTISPSGHVINGNGRQMSLEAARHVGTYEKYRAMLEAKAEQFGLDPAQVRKMKEPALYRVVHMELGSPEAHEFARVGNVQAGHAQRPERIAASLAHLITPNMVASLKLKGDETFSRLVNDSTGKDFREKLFLAMPPPIRGQYFEEGQRLTEAGKEMVQHMMLAKVLPIEMVEELGRERRQMLNTIEGAVPQLLKIATDPAMAKVNVVPQMIEALTFLMKHERVKDAADAKNALDQLDLFSGRPAAEVSPGGRMMVDFLLERGSQPREFRTRLDQVIAGEKASAGLWEDPNAPHDPMEDAAKLLDVKHRTGADFGNPETLAAKRRAAQRPGFVSAGDILKGIGRLIFGNRSPDANFTPDTDPRPDNPRAMPDWTTSTAAAKTQLGARDGTPMAVATTAHAWQRHVGDQVANAWLVEHRHMPDAFPMAKDGTIELANGTRGHMSDVIEAELRNPGSQPLTAAQNAAVRMWQNIHEKQLKALEAANAKGFYDDQGNIVTAADLVKEGYFPREVKPKTAIGTAFAAIFGKKAGGASSTPGMKPFYRKGRVHETEEAGATAGVQYKPFYERVADFIRYTNREIADHNLANDPKLGGVDVIKPYFQRLMAENKATLNQLPAPMQDALTRQFAMLASQAATGNVFVAPAFKGKEYPAEAKAHIEAMYGTKFGAIAGFGNALSKEINAFTLAADASYVTLQLGKMMFANPIRVARTVARVPEAIFNSQLLGKVVNNDPASKQAMQEMSQVGARFGSTPDVAAPGTTLAERIPVVGRVYKGANQAFATIMDLAKIEMWKADRPDDPKQWPRAVEAIENSLGQGRMEQLGMTPERAMIERLAFLAPSYYRAHIKLLQQMSEGGAAGKIARKQIGALASGVLLTSIGLLYALRKDGQITQDEMEERLDPSRGKFLMVPVRLGTSGKSIELGFGGFYRSMVRTAGNVMAGESQSNPLTHWYRGHAGALPRISWDVLTERDYSGKPVKPQEVALRSVMPISASQAAMEKGTPEQHAANVGAGLIGLSSFPSSESGDRTERLRKFAEARGKQWSKMSLPEQAIYVKHFDKIDPKPAKTAEEELMAKERAAAADVEHKKRVTEKLSGQSKDVLKALGHEMAPGYEGILHINGANVPLSRDRRNRYEELLAEEYDRTLKLVPKEKLTAAPQALREDALKKWLGAAKERAQKRLIVESTK